MELASFAVPEDDYLSMKHLDAWKSFETYLDHAEMLLRRSNNVTPAQTLSPLLTLFAKISR